MRLLLICALVLVPALAHAQGPISDSVIKLAQEDVITSREIGEQSALVDVHAAGKHQHYDERFWLGTALVVAGAITTIVSVTSMRQSDLSQENPNTRINVHLAPCGTDPAATTLAIADCKPHYPLMGVGLGLVGGGTVLMVRSSYAHPSVGFRVRF